MAVKLFKLKAHRLQFLNTTNTLAYYSTELIMAVKMFVMPACGLQFFNTTDTLAYFCTEFIMSVKCLLCRPVVSNF